MDKNVIVSVSGMLFAKGKVLRKVPEDQMVDALFEEIDKL